MLIPLITSLQTPCTADIRGWQFKLYEADKEKQAPPELPMSLQ